MEEQTGSEQYLVKCVACGYENEDIMLFCRSCLTRLDPFGYNPNYGDENFHRLREASLGLINKEISIENYWEILDEISKKVNNGLVKLQSIDISENTMKKVEYQKKLCEKGLELYTQAMEIFFRFSSSGEIAEMIEALTLAEEGNHSLNMAFEIVEIRNTEEDSATSVDLRC